MGYSPSRDILAKLRRRTTQWRAARPAILRFAEPILSVTFDDFPASAADVGAHILERYGARGTFYASSGLAGADGPCGRNFSPADLRQLSMYGHEIGCHTASHGDCAQRDFFTTLQDLAQNRDALVAMGAAPPRAHAYPYGEAHSALKENLPPRLTSARGVLPGPNVGRSDLAQLRAYPLFGGGALARIHADLRRASKRNAWIIAFTHDVSDAPSPWGTSAADLDALMRAAHRLGFVVLPVSTALERRLA
jgi:peptidoglycan/xylan/chitin deacetylase (PgdA/CDA1 family)